MQRSLLVISLMFLSLVVWGQKKPLQLMMQDGEQSFIEKRYKLKDSYAGRDALNKDLQKLLLALYKDGYLSASVDTVEDLEDKYVAWLFVGQKYEWVSLKAGNVPEPVLDHVRFKEKQYPGRKVSYKEVNTLLNQLLDHQENNGYPFAMVKLDNIYLDGSGIEAELYLQPNQAVKYDTIAIIGKCRVNRRYLYNYLGIKPGNLYSEKDVQGIANRLNELPFVEQTQPLDVTFVADKAKINLYLKNKNASNVDLLLGVLPNNEITGRVLITGQAKLDLVSPFGTGKELHINWQKLQDRTQQLDVGLVYPYILATPLGADVEFHLYKRDTLYLDIDYTIGLQYLFVGRNYVKAFFHNKFTNVLNLDTAAVRRNKKLPIINDVNNTLYGLEYAYQKLDDRFNPHKGFYLKTSGAIGTKQIKKNNTIIQLKDPENPDETLESLYDSVRLKSVHYQFRLKLANYFPIKRRSTIVVAIDGGAYLGKNIFQNELFRLGGINLLRGFDEESIFASLYTVLTLEYRFKLSKQSFLQLFFDGAYMEDRTVGQYYNDWPYGFGLGLSFQTKAGMFGVSYALGAKDNRPIDFKSAKIHFGYYNYF